MPINLKNGLLEPSPAFLTLKHLLPFFLFFIVQGFIHFTNLRDLIRDILLCISFLSFFIIQRAVNKTTASIQIKINELIASHDKARNEIIDIDKKTGTELEELKNIRKKDLP